MPASPTYPGVYVQELPSGNRTIVGVSTSITAFVGRALRGQTDEAVLVSSFGDFGRTFGGLWARSPMSYAVQQYFLAGGRDALIVRVTDTTPTANEDEEPGTATAASVTLGLEDTLYLRSRNAGTANDWGENYQVTITHEDESAVSNGIHRFVLTLSDTTGTNPYPAEPYNVTMIRGDDPEWIYIGDLPEAVAAGQIADVLRVPTRRPRITASASFSNAVEATATPASFEVAPVSGLVLTAPDVGTPGNALRASITHGSNRNQFTLDVTDGTTSLSGFPVDLSTTEADATGGYVYVASWAAPAGVILQARSLDRPEPVTDAEFAGGTDTAKAEVALPGVRGARFEATGTAGSDVRVAITRVTGSATQFDLTVSYPSSTPPDVTYRVTVNAEDHDEAASTPVYFIGNLPEAADVAVSSYSGHRPDDATARLLSVNPAFTDTDEDLLTLSAMSEGAWGNQLRVTITQDISDPTDESLFTLVVSEVDADEIPLVTETYRNVSLDPTHRRYLVTVLAEESDLVEMSAVPALYQHNRPSVSSEALTGGTDGGAITTAHMAGNEGTGTGIHALARADLFNLLCLPPPDFDDPIALTDNIWNTALTLCERKRAVCLVDAPTTWDTVDAARIGMTDPEFTSANAAMYFPWVRMADPLRQNRLRSFAPCGVVAGLIARTDGQRGIWKAPAGQDVRTPVLREPALKLTDVDNGLLNPLGLNCFRSFPGVGTVVWGARTLEGSDRLASDWKYLPVRRLALYIEESLYRGLQWAVFEPNDGPLWAQIRLSVGGFMTHLFRQGAFKGTTPKDAWYVKCDAETTTTGDIDRGIVNVQVGFAPLKPAEFVILSIQQMAGQTGE